MELIFPFKLKPHPLFLLAGAVSAFTGDLPLFLAAVLAALEHECAHAFVARRYGFTLDTVNLMPYGAVLSGDLTGIPPCREIAVCLAGPIASGLTALAFTALWWLYPETYPYTEAAAAVSASLLFVNLLPAYPLDGGRILRVLLRPIGERRSLLVCKAVTALIAVGILGFFIYTCFSAPNFTALCFSVFLAGGLFGGGSYHRVVFSHEKNFSRGVEEKRIALSGDLTVSDALKFLREDRYLVLILFREGEFEGEVAEEELLGAIERGEYARPLRELL